MHITITASLASAILAIIPSVSGHCAFIGAVGDHANSPNGKGLGVVDSTPRNGVDQLPFQRDTSVFASPLVPWTQPKCWSDACCKKGKYACYNKKYYTPVGRKYIPQGCGATLYNVNHWESQYHPAAWKKAAPYNARKNVWWYQQPLNPAWNNDIAYGINEIVGAKRLPVATAGGYLKITVHQVNSDGAGPFKCRIDEGASGNFDSKWLKVTTNVPGDKNSLNGYSEKQWPLVVQLPADMNCRGGYSGQKNICIVRCENSAVNGPFGGCIPFQQYTAPYQGYKPTPPSYNNNAGYKPAPNNYVDNSEYNNKGGNTDYSGGQYKRGFNETEVVMRV
ncbi:hypothetical protein TWF694_008115 [Orbilia ellipsospora]|uniref:Uncharacterized protein n=1 Tax=Orbilia ellipsospora TaxID=2528407 RepID=A0AAV9XFS2_9PEZI